jgi:hypothetical protein
MERPPSLRLHPHLRVGIIVVGRVTKELDFVGYICTLLEYEDREAFMPTDRSGFVCWNICSLEPGRVYFFVVTLFDRAKGYLELGWPGSFSTKVAVELASKYVDCMNERDGDWVRFILFLLYFSVCLSLSILF